MHTRFFQLITAICTLGSATLATSGCVVTGHPAGDARWGTPASASRFEAALDAPGPIEVESVAAASWQVPLEGMLNLEHPRAKAAKLESHPEPITLYFHALRHPTRGLFIVDTGVERAFVSDPEHALVSGMTARLAGLDTLRVHVDLATWLARQGQPLSAVLLTHLHLDHIMGLRDVPRGTPIFVGPGEARAHGALNLFTRPIADRALQRHAALAEWQFEPDAERRFAGVLDVLGDGSLWALHVPGHTPGSTAYVARTPRGPVLLTGDACHTSWGWQHGVEPGSFSSDVPESARSLASLQGLVKRHPSMGVRLGHQSLGQALTSGHQAR